MGSEATQFKKGNPGRPKGSPNRSTEMMKRNISRAVNGQLDELKKDLDKIRQEDPVLAIKLVTKLMEYVLPKMRAVDVEGSMKVENEIKSINVNITSNVKEHGEVEKNPD